MSRIKADPDGVVPTTAVVQPHYGSAVRGAQHWRPASPLVVAWRQRRRGGA
jgi:hypothetical protein